MRAGRLLVLVLAALLAATLGSGDPAHAGASPGRAAGIGKAPAAAPASPASGGKHRVRVMDVRLQRNGAAKVLAERVASRAPATTPLRRGTGRARVVVRTAGGAVLHTRAGFDTTVRGEFPDQPGSRVLGHDHLTAREPVAQVVVPASARPRALTVRWSGRTFRATDVRRSVARAARSARAATVVPIPGWTNGPAANRLNLVILGDGYTAGQQDDFADDAKDVADGIFDVQPYKSYRDFVNVVGVFAPSAQQGADQPAYSSSCVDRSVAPACCPDADAPATSTFVTTRYDSTFCSFGIQRLLVPANVDAVYADAAAYPDWDQLMVVVDDGTYGGSGGGIATTSKNLSGVSVMTHELGHSLMQLDDEYTTSTPGYPPCSDRGRNGVTDLCAPNITDVTVRASLKWRRWVDAGTPIPTPSPQPASVVGDFEGGHYDPHTYYRPCDACLMQYLDTPMGDVESEQLPLRMFDGTAAGFGIDLIEPSSEQPATGAPVTVSPGQHQTFAMDVLSTHPSPGTHVTWTVDGTTVQQGDVGTGTASYELVGDGDPHTVVATAQALPGILHPSDVGITSTSTTWTVQGGAPEPFEALSNGGFEQRLGTAWHAASGASRLCSSRARTGSCAAKLVAARHGVSLTQDIDVAGFTIGGTVTLEGALDSIDLASGGQAVLKLTGADGSQSLRLTWSNRDRHDRARYVLRSADLTLAAAPTSARLTVKLPAGTGSALVDDLSVHVTP
ncbi:M64 family metallopeptidase [Nocardioides panacisoli]|uniref:Peptidase M64 n=1 Tax=Nocardioides panacisoli TaxID=627624 RepID=A0ABP7ITV0_9ACTN